MKTTYAALLLALGTFGVSQAQIKTTGVVTVTPDTAQTPITLKLDLNKYSQKVTMTVTGPADRMFYIGFGGTTMGSTSAPITDAVAFTQAGACDQLRGTADAPSPYIAPAGPVVLDCNGFTGRTATVKDAVNDWTVISDDGITPTATPPAAGTIRTVVATRALNTNSAEDFAFDFDTLTNLNIIWASGRDYSSTATPVNPDNYDNGYWSLSGFNTIGVTTRHNNVTRGTKSLAFTETEVRTTGLVTVTPDTAQTPITFKLDMDKTMGLVYMTASGPADRMFYIGFGGTTMGSTSAPITDAVAFTQAGACDQLRGTADAPSPYIAPAGPVVLDCNGFTGRTATVKDAVNDWTVISDDGITPTATPPAAGTIRTVVATRALNTNSAEDFAFDFDTLTNLNIIWASGRDYSSTATPVNPDNYDNGYWSLSGFNTIGVTTRHNNVTRGTKILTFGGGPVSGVEDFTTVNLNNISIYPNPTTGIVNILNDNSSISTVRVFDINARLLQEIKEINRSAGNENVSINLSDCTKGIYFMEISNGKNKVVKKVILE